MVSCPVMVSGSEGQRPHPHQPPEPSGGHLLPRRAAGVPGVCQEVRRPTLTLQSTWQMRALAKALGQSFTLFSPLWLPRALAFLAVGWEVAVSGMLVLSLPLCNNYHLLHSLGARHPAKHFLYSISPNPPNNPVRYRYCYYPQFTESVGGGGQGGASLNLGLFVFNCLALNCALPPWGCPRAPPLPHSASKAPCHLLVSVASCVFEKYSQQQVVPG